uniref:Intermediate capsid protein VP6 n=30 Tax=Rotavirus A TaxID=28875 RepID=A0A160RK70_9REOV|nr:inner capsid VP6 protein [Avian rotavirus A (RVA/chicken/Nigeria/NIE11-250/2011)]CDS82606.1 inner capsid VP6 protein [Avian rotavirus A (RVA/chicken/Nigeria/NIE11-251/2011)]CDS82608.1 inner capsid VP6 protein [Avian rotavirus A (RVA/chicken/Nigeria/NIE11-253/2011)]CDS82609.1 inner capsid VP6 protein [Avian rotavirus A (RVA/chicken/Nigeria/NIE11-254/2011)]CDS82610.1 inner capsid VP6 protein [Avian rotavirus A (RVA/chicken/Nigeria/NIE11-255/2011)]CDS82613.1 inner capsid VP6 protein [Avian rot
MDVLYSLAKTLKEARAKIVEGTLYTNVADIVQQINQVINSLNGSTFQTGGIGNFQIRDWTFDFGALGTTLLNLDANYVENARATIDYFIDFVDHVCIDEIVRESQRNGIAPQSNALRQLSAARYRRINYDNDSEYIENWNLQNRRQRTGYLFHKPNILPYNNSFTLTRSQPAHDNVCGTMWLNNGSEIEIIGFDSECALNAQANVQAFQHVVPLGRVLNNATVSLLPYAPRLMQRAVIPTADGQNTWLFDPVMLRPHNPQIEFLLNGQVITVYQARYGTLSARNFDTIRLSFQLVRPQNMTPAVAALFPVAAPFPNHAAVGLTLNIDSALCESVLTDANEPYLSIVTGLRQEYAIPVGPVFPAGMNWTELLNNYSASREDNLQRIFTVASIRSMVIK